MTHDETYQTDKFDELLAKIDYNQVEGTWDIDMKSQRFDLVAQNYRALRAVVELCNKWETKGSYCLPIGDVIQAIENELV